MRLPRVRIFAIAQTAIVMALLIGGSALAKSKPWIGVYMQELTPTLAEAFELSIKSGVVINDVEDDSPADEAGLKAKDIVVMFNGKKVEDPDELSELVSAMNVGDKVTLGINRKGKAMDLVVTVGERKEPRVYSFRSDDGNRIAVEKLLDGMKRSGIGVSLQSLSGDLGTYFGVADGEGALITEVKKETPAEKAGLKVGDVIVKVDGESVETPGDVSELIGDKDKGDKVELGIVRDKTERTITLEVDEIQGEMSWNWFDNDDGLHSMMLDLERKGSGRVMVRPHSAPEAFDMQRQMEELQAKLEKLQQKLEQLESRMK